MVRIHFIFITDFFEKYIIFFSSYEAADQNQLWEHLTEAAHLHDVLDTNLTVKEIMDTWTLQIGFPLVTVKRDTKNKNKLILKQERFIYEYSNATKSQRSNCTWFVPITFTTESVLQFENSTAPTYWMLNSPELVINTKIKEEDFFIFNIQQTGNLLFLVEKTLLEIVKVLQKLLNVFLKVLKMLG